jgi:hypothetical protein
MNRRFASVLLAVAVGMGACGKSTPERANPAPAAPQSPAPASYPVTLLFDGGYAFISDYAAKTLTVAAFDAGHEMGRPANGVPPLPPHAMKLRLDTGTVASAPPALQRTQDIVPTWSLDEATYDIDFPDPGLTPPGVVEPDVKSITPGDPCNDRIAPNNAALMPTMDVLASEGKFDGTVVTDRKTYKNRVLLSSGTMSIVDLTSCMNFTVGSQVVESHRVPNGLGGIHVDLVASGNLRVRLTDAQGNMQMLEFSPVKDALGKLGLQLWFGRFPPPCSANDPGCYYKVGQTIADFDRFYHLLKSPLDMTKRVMPVNASARDEVCPGSQCPSLHVRLNKKN